ncbi:MAG: LCP family protein [Armatimonadota bacterium]
MKILNNKGISRIGMVFLVLAAMIASVIAGTSLGYFFPGINTTVKEFTAPPFGGRTVVKILVLGEDNTGGTKDKLHGLSDTIMLASVDFTNNTISSISIPRDTRIDIPGYGIGKINAANAFEGPLLTAQMVETLTGIRPNYYIKTNVEGFKETVDLVGGVEIDVEKNMRYNDNWGNLHINLKKGLQMLDGENAMGYVRFRHDKLGDITRMERQRKFMKALAKRMLEPSRLPKLPWTIKSVMRNVATDMTSKDLLYLAKFAGKVDMDKAQMETLPGGPQTVGGVSYWIPDEDQISEMVTKLFLTQTIAGLPKVEILNGSGISGAAQKAADAFRLYGYEVISVGNADSFKYESSQVINHKPEIKGLDKISVLVNSSIVKDLPDPTAPADVTVIIGKDCLLLNKGT